MLRARVVQKYKSDRKCLSFKYTPIDPILNTPSFDGKIRLLRPSIALLPLPRVEESKH